MLIAQALTLLQRQDLAALESELHRVEASYRFSGRLRTAAEETAQRLTVENNRLRLYIQQLEADRRTLLRTEAGNVQIVQQVLDRMNTQAQERMAEIAALRAEVQALTSQPG